MASRSPSSVPLGASAVQVLVGGYTADMEGSATGISSLTVAVEVGGTVESRGPVGDIRTTALTSPSYLVRHPGQPWLFAVSEGEPGVLSSFAVDPDGGLSPIDALTLLADGPCHLVVTPDGRHVVVANYLSGSVSCYGIGAGGSLTAQRDLLQFTGSGPDPDRQAGPHAHQVVVDGDELLICDLGTDQIHRLRLSDDGLFSRPAPPVQLPSGTGPRHLVLLGDQLVVACELSAQLWLARRTGSGWEQQHLIPSTGVHATPLAAATDARSASTEIQTPPTYPSAIVADGSRIYVANRGPGTVGVFDLDPSAGRLVEVAEFPCGGEWPRDLALSPGLLWVANQTNDVVSVFATDELPPPGPLFAFESPSPACLLLSAATPTGASAAIA